MDDSRELPDLVQYKDIPFARVTARKAAECWHCLGRILPGETAYAPINNCGDRWRRLDLRCARVFEVKL